MKSPAPATPDVFYPIVPDVGWLERLVPLGVQTMQLRIKDRATRRFAARSRQRFR